MTTVVQETTIKSWLKKVSGFDAQHVIASDQSGERPNSSYITFRYIGGRTDDYSALFQEVPDPNPDLEIEESVATRETLVYQIDVYHKNGKDLINDLWLSRSNGKIRKALKAGGITISVKTGTRNFTALEDSSFAPRFNVDITFLGEAELNFQQDLGDIGALWDELIFTGTFKGYDA